MPIELIIILHANGHLVFSAIKRVKTWLRSTTEHTRFSTLSIPHIERDLSDNVNTEDIVDTLPKKSGAFY